MIDKIDIRKAAQWLRSARQITVLTGAGASKESGVPTFRDAMDGLWSRYDPQQLATLSAFQKNPKLVWDWYEYRREMVNSAKPNAGHLALAQLEDVLKNIHVITQNVDDLHERAGSRDVIHLHGNIAQNKCINDCTGRPTLIDVSQLTWDKEQGPPKCPHCGKWVRPDVVWFGELLPTNAIQRATDLSEACDVMLVIGTSGMVTPAASLPILARQRGARIIEINPSPSTITPITDLFLQAPSGEVLPRVLAAVETT